MSTRNPHTVAAVPHSPILTDAEVSRRMMLLAELQGTLDALGVRAVLARNHRLVLKYNDSPVAPSGLTDPVLHVLIPSGTRAVTTDGTSYCCQSTGQWPVTDPAAATAIAASLPAREQAAGQAGPAEGGRA